MTLAIRFPTQQKAYSALSELRRLYDISSYGEVRVEQTGGHALLWLPKAAWERPGIADVVRRYGGREPH